MPLNKFSLNHLNQLLDVFSRESIKSSILFADVNGVIINEIGNIQIFQEQK